MGGRPASFPLVTVIVTLTGQFLVTVARRTEPPLYVSLWYLIAAVWTDMSLMALAALSAFVWGAASGALRDVESVKHRVLEAEDDEPRRP